MYERRRSNWRPVYRGVLPPDPGIVAVKVGTQLVTPDPDTGVLDLSAALDLRYASLQSPDPVNFEGPQTNFANDVVIGNDWNTDGAKRLIVHTSAYLYGKSYMYDTFYLSHRDTPAPAGARGAPPAPQPVSASDARAVVNAVPVVVNDDGGLPQLAVPHGSENSPLVSSTGDAMHYGALFAYLWAAVQDLQRLVPAPNQ